jgi:hypothetical protein
MIKINQIPSHMLIEKYLIAGKLLRQHMHHACVSVMWYWTWDHVKTVLKGWLGCVFIIVWGMRKSQGILFSINKLQIQISKIPNHCFNFFKPSCHHLPYGQYTLHCFVEIHHLIVTLALHATQKNVTNLLSYSFSETWIPYGQDPIVR